MSHQRNICCDKSPQTLSATLQSTDPNFQFLFIAPLFGKQLFWECRFVPVEENMWQFVKPPRHLLAMRDCVAFSDWSWLSWLNRMFCSLLAKVNPVTCFIIRLLRTVLNLLIVSWFVMFPLHSHSLDSFESYSGNTHLLDVLTSTSFSHCSSLLICLKSVQLVSHWLGYHSMLNQAINFRIHINGW